MRSWGLTLCSCHPGFSWRGLDISVWTLTALAATWSSTEHVHYENLPRQKQFPRNEAMADRTERARQMGWSCLLRQHTCSINNMLSAALHCSVACVSQHHVKLMDMSCITIRKLAWAAQKGSLVMQSVAHDSPVICRQAGLQCTSATLNQLCKGLGDAASIMQDKAEGFQDAGWESMLNTQHVSCWLIEGLDPRLEGQS